MTNNKGNKGAIITFLAGYKDGDVVDIIPCFLTHTLQIGGPRESGMNKSRFFTGSDSCLFFQKLKSTFCKL